jgi:hypothetical protein
MKLAKINVNSDKFELIFHSSTNFIMSELTLPNEKNEQIPIKVCDVKDILKYLEAPLNQRRFSKM